LEIARYGVEGYDRVAHSVGLGFRVNRVCAQCNSGWLSRLEQESSPILQPLIQGLDDYVFLTLREQRQIALWATKTAMVVDQTQADPLIPFTQRSRLRTHRAIPRGTRVWIGACEELDPLVTARTIRSVLRRP